MTPEQRKQIDAVIEAGKKIATTIIGSTIEYYYEVKPHKALALWGSDGDLLAVFEGDWDGTEVDDAEVTLRRIQAAAAREAIEAMAEENKRFRDALEFYARPQDARTSATQRAIDRVNYRDDFGYKAKQALEGGDDE